MVPAQGKSELLEGLLEEMGGCVNNEPLLALGLVILFVGKFEN